MKNKHGKIAWLVGVFALMIGALAHAVTFAHKPMPYFVEGKPQRIEATVTDPRGLQQVRVYFRLDGTYQDLYFLPMQLLSEGRYTATLPAIGLPEGRGMGRVGLTYLFLAQTRDGHAARSKDFTVQGREGTETVPSWQTASKQGIVKIFSESPKPVQPSHLSFDVTRNRLIDAPVDFVEPNARLLGGATLVGEGPSSDDYCERDSYSRGIGVPMTQCMEGAEYSLGSCYSERCKANYHGAGPICWGNCPSGWTDHGVGCTKPPPYGRGAGYAWAVGDAIGDAGMYQRCEGANGKGNCEKDGALIYPKCKAGYHKVGCCTCTPDCPSGFGDTGATCTKPSYSRVPYMTSQSGDRQHFNIFGDLKLLRCGDGKEQERALCYSPCKATYTAGDVDTEVERTCLRNCPSNMPHQCGKTCVRTAKDCTVRPAGWKGNNLGRCPAS